MSTPALPSANQGTPFGYLRTVKAGTVDALNQALTFMYPEPDAAGGSQLPYVSIEYPVNPANYPGVWVDFETSMLQTSGIDHVERTPGGAILTRWRFQGYATFTVTALNSNECDNLYDQLIALTAFAAQSEYNSPFRAAIENNALVATTWGFDKIEGRGQAAAPGTPWNTDDLIYERSIAIQVVGEFVTEPITLQLFDLREIIITATPVNPLEGQFIATID